MHRFLLACGLISVASAVQAGDLAATSRESIGIRIIVPPRIQITHLDAGRVASDTAFRACLSSMGADNYQLILLTEPGDGPSARLPLAPSRKNPDCADLPRGFPGEAAALASGYRGPANVAGPVVLLTVPM